MKIITRGEGIPAYSTKKGTMAIDNTEGKFWLKMDVALGKEQYIVELEKWDLARLISIALQDKDVVEICRRNRWLPEEAKK